MAIPVQATAEEAGMASKNSPKANRVGSDRHALEGGRALMASRTAASHAAFLLPYLRPGMSLLDAGCGGGSITIGLAGVVSPGKVVGIDIEAKQIEVARAAAASQRVTNVVFQLGNVYELPFADDSLDAVFNHAVLEHLSDPLRALTEFRRVLKPGGVLGVRAPDARGNLGDPTWYDPDFVKINDLLRQLVEHNGGNWYIGPQLKRLLREAALHIEEEGASYSCFATPEALRQLAQGAAAMFRSGPTADQLIELGWINRDELERIAGKVLSWAEGPDAFHARAGVHAVARKS